LGAVRDVILCTQVAVRHPHRSYLPVQGPAVTSFFGDFFFPWRNTHPWGPGLHALAEPGGGLSCAAIGYFLWPMWPSSRRTLAPRPGMRGVYGRWRELGAEPWGGPNSGWRAVTTQRPWLRLPQRLRVPARLCTSAGGRGVCAWSRCLSVRLSVCRFALLWLGEGSF
jgi:hypothetical protein